MNGVDVLAVMDDAAVTLAKTAQIQMTERAAEMREARAAVAELMADAEELLFDLELDMSASPYSSFRMINSGNRVTHLRAALARVGGAK